MPATGNYILDKGFDTDTALVKYRGVKLSAANPEAVTAITALGEDGIGVAQFDVAAGEITKGKGASVRIEGISEMEASAAITKGAEVTVAADGRVVTCASTQRVWGRALQGASGAGVRISVLLNAAKIIKA
jgi:hypothetical protein